MKRIPFGCISIKDFLYSQEVKDIEINGNTVSFSYNFDDVITKEQLTERYIFPISSLISITYNNEYYVKSKGSSNDNI